MNKRIKLSVHQLVDFLLRTGDIDDRVFNKDTMKQGSILHSLYQKSKNKNYISEYFLSNHFEIEEFDIVLEGRADGIVIEDIPIIDEIKTTNTPLDEFYYKNKRWHLGQAICYAYMFCLERGYEKCKIQLAYFSQVTDDKDTKTFVYTLDELKKEIYPYLYEYVKFIRLIENLKTERNKSCEELPFPFNKFREGQRKLAKYSYNIAKKGGILFVEAPTGIGKTVSTLYPFIKSFKDEYNEKIFYLTAKTSGRLAAFDTVELLKNNGLKAREIIISAKDKICFNKKCRGCNPDVCPYAKDYYTKITDVIIETLSNYDTYDNDLICKIANENKICPFEFQLDLSLYSDIIICDYNYLFDPIVYMQRYFDNDSSQFLCLVDEAHNLVDRGREMYSMSIDLNRFLEAKKYFKHVKEKEQIKKVKNGFNRIIKMFEKYDDINEPLMIDVLDHKDFLDINYLSEQLKQIRPNLQKINYDLSFLTEISRDLNRFLKLMEIRKPYDNLYFLKENNNLYLVLKAIDIKDRLRESLNQVKGSVIFSATLSPLDYFVDVIGGNEIDPVLQLKSPFKQENLEVLVAPNVSVQYKDRSSTYNIIAKYIDTFVSQKNGNYLIYLPSFEYLENIESYLIDKDYILVKQEKEFDEVQKEQFLSMFSEKPINTTVGLAVLGGQFSEGIDLINDRLIGVAIVGVGLPQLCFEKDLIKNYYNKTNNKLGFEYSYVNPGINKVLQAAGRVIRTENDKGAILLIDDRYLTNRYLSLFETHWSHYKVVFNENDIKTYINSFWNKHNV